MANNMPKVNINIESVPDAPTSDRRALFVQQQLSTGTATNKVLVEDVTPNEVNNLFGEGSNMALAIQRFQGINTDTPVDAIPIDDPTGTASSGTIIIGGTATASGTFTVQIGSTSYGEFSVEVAEDDAGTAVSAALAPIIDASPAFTALDAAGTITVTFAHEGTCGDEIEIKADSVAGLTVALTDFTSGAGTTDVVSIFTQTAETRYTSIIFHEAFDETELLDYLTSQASKDNSLLDGMAWIGVSGTVSELIALDKTANNNQYIVYPAKPIEARPFDMTFLIASEGTSIKELRLIGGADVSDYVFASNRDVIGGLALASLPFYNTITTIPTIGKRLPGTIIDALNDNGISTLSDGDGGLVYFDEVVTSYVKDDKAQPDSTFKWMEAVDTTSAIREIFFVEQKNKFHQTRLTKGTPRAGRNEINKSRFETFLLGVYKSLGSADFVLVESGASAEDAFKASLNVVVDTVNGTITTSFNAVITVQARIFTTTITIVR